MTMKDSLDTSVAMSNGYQTPTDISPLPAPRPSRPVQGEEGLGQILGVFRRRAFIVAGVAIAFFGYSAWKTLNQTTLYQGNVQILVEPVNAENANLAMPTGDGARQRASGLDYATQIAILKSPKLLGEVVTELQKDYPSLNYKALANQVDISQLGKTKLIQVDYQSNSETQSRAVLSALAGKYLQYSLNERQTYLRQGLQFVDEQLNTLRDRLNGLQDRLENFQQENSFGDPETQSAQLSTQMATLNQKQQDLEQELAAVQSRRAVLNQDKGIQVAIEQSPAYQQLQDQVRAIDAQIATELTRFRPENPAIKSLEKQRDNLLPLMEKQAEQFLSNRLAESDVQSQVLNTQLQSVNAAKAALETQAQQVPSLNRQYTALQKEIEITDASLEGFLETRQTLQVEAAQREIPWELVREPAIVPIASDPVKSLMTALLMGLALGGAAAFAIDKLDNTYHTVEDLKAKVNLPVLGVLPFNQQLFLDEGGISGNRHKRKLLSRLRSMLIKSSAKVSKSMSAIALSLLDEYDTSAEFVESLRMTNAHLQIGNSGKPIRTITISSAAPDDGKSMLALNWAETAVSMGQRVLIIDGVLRNPQLHRMLNLPNDVGLSSLLNTDLKPPEGIQQVRANDKLYVVTGGPTVDNPVNLLGSLKMQLLLAHCRTIFDLIIIDTPQLSSLVDASVINRFTDGLVLVARLDQTDKSVLQQTMEKLEDVNTNMIGLVINGNKKRSGTFRESDTDSAYIESSERSELQRL
ncbi:MAG: polysaccharide biosynthesis tyrosine autokinase [Phormidesmis sp.]